MARILYWTDLHSNIKLFNSMSASGVPMRAPEIINTFVWLQELVEKENIDRVVFGGDLFNTVRDLTMPFFNMTYKGLYNIKVSMDLLDGNHDKYDPIYRVMDPFRSFARVHSVPESYYDNTLGMKIIYLPFQRDVRDKEDGTKVAVAEDTIEKLTKEEVPTLIFMHQGIKGFFPDELAVDKNIFKKPHIKRVFGGHYHFKFEESVGGVDKKIVFPGSVISLHFDDNMASKYVVVYDTKTDEVKWIENPNTAYFISLRQDQISAIQDKLEQLASVSYLRVTLDEQETLKIPISFLLKFKGYIITSNKVKSHLYKVGSEEGSGGFNYEEFSALVNSEQNMSFDLSFDDFKSLVLASSDKNVEKQISDQILTEVLQSAYLVGNNSHIS